jgi:hypothetical protein
MLEYHFLAKLDLKVERFIRWVSTLVESSLGMPYLEQTVVTVGQITNLIVANQIDVPLVES